MKKFIYLLAFAFVSTIFLDSCSVQKRYHRKGYTINWNHVAFSAKNNKKSKENESELAMKDQKMENEDLSENFKRNTSNYNVSEKYTAPQTMDVASVDNVIPVNENIEDVEYLVSLKNEKSKVRLPKKETKVGFFQKVISNRINKSIDKIKKANAELKNPVREGETKLHWAALTGFIISLLGLFIFPIIFGTMAIVFSAIGLSAVKKNPSTYKGKGFAIAGLVIGIIDVVFIFLLLVLLLAAL